MVRRWTAAAVVLVGLLAGCSSATDGRGAPEGAPTSTPEGLPVPSDPVEPTTPAGTTPAGTTPAGTTPAGTTPAPATSPAGRPCPADVTRTLPGGGPATLVAGYGTTRFRLFFCRSDRGLYYRGISRADPSRATTLPARTVSGGYEAVGTENGDTFVYRVAQRRLSVTKNGKPLFTDPVTSTL
ncbi:MAG TPA: hypothetical protein VLM05_06385 [Mycobacteriales bacterium]|nr:hypothetical protein [Mycobacteriales bacterium]